MLGRCYKAELVKLLKGKGIYIALACMLIMVIFFGVFANVYSESPLAPDEALGIQDRLLELIWNTPREEYDNTIKNIKDSLKQLEGDNNTSWSRFNDTKGIVLTYVSILEYLKEHEEINPNTLDLPSNSLFNLGSSSYNFLISAFSMLLEMAMFYAIIMMSTLLVQEYREGTLKMQILRPNSRKTMLTAKWLAVMTLSTMLFLFGVIVSALFAGIHFKFTTSTLLCVVNNTHVFTMNSNVFVIMQILLSLFALFAMLMFTTFMCNIMRFNRAASMAVPIILMVLGNFSAVLLQVVYLGMFDFMNNLNLISFFIPLGQGLPNVSLFSALPILVTYVTIFIVVSYVKFDRAEL